MGLLSSFLGKDQRRDLEAANAQATGQVNQGYAQGDARYAEAENMFAPYAQGGQQGQKIYDDLLGINGPQAQQAAQGIYAGDKYEQDALNQGNNAMLRYFNARGNVGSAAPLLAGARAAGERYGSWRDLFRGRGEQGYQATNAMAGLRANRGDMAIGRGTTLAGNSVNFGNAMAANRNTGINNLMGIAGLGVNALTAGMKPKLGS
jgi:hypothetical protein